MAGIVISFFVSLFTYPTKLKFDSNQYKETA